MLDVHVNNFWHVSYTVIPQYLGGTVLGPPRYIHNTQVP
jgi:hypothetical protein